MGCFQEREKMKKGTSTSSFGNNGRFNHDSSIFYGLRMYRGLNGDESENVFAVEKELPRQLTNRILWKSSESMKEIPNNSIHLMITSPPYNVGKEYDEDLSLQEYGRMLRRVFKETYRVLVTGGRACINVANIGRKPYIPLHKLVIDEMINIGFLMRGEIIWNKGASAGSSTAWGSWLSAGNSVLRDVHEYILVFSKQSFSREKTNAKSTITTNEFLKLTKSVWTFPSIAASVVGHPAPFPEELPRRLIRLYSFEGDVVLDPFCGSGTTCIVALKQKRKFIGYDNKKKYVSLAKQRLKRI